MKNTGTTTILNWALTIAVIALAVCSIQYFFKTREVRNLQSKIVEYQNKQQFLNSLIADCMEYSKRNPAIDPILEANNLKPKAAGTKPAAK